MKKLFSFALLAIMIMSASCAHSDNPLVGEWEQKVDQNGATVVANYDFKSNGKCHQTMVLKSDMPKIDVEGSGTFDYTYEDDVITLTFSGDDFKFKKFEIEGLPEEMVDIAMEQMKSQLVDMTETMTDVKIDGNTLTATYKGMDITLERK